MKVNIENLLLILLLLCLLFTFRNNCMCVEPFQLIDIPHLALVDNRLLYERQPEQFKETVPVSVFAARRVLQIFPRMERSPTTPDYEFSYTPDIKEIIRLMGSPWQDDHGFYIGLSQRNIEDNQGSSSAKYVDLAVVLQNQNRLLYRNTSVDLRGLLELFQDDPPTLEEWANNTHQYIHLVNPDESDETNIRHGSLTRIYPDSWRNVAHHSRFWSAMEGPRTDLRYGIARNSKDRTSYLVYFWREERDDKGNKQITPLDKFRFSSISEISNLNSENPNTVLGNKPDRPRITQAIFYDV